MALYIHITSDCEIDARTYNQDRLLKNLSESVRTSQNLTGFDTLLPSPFVKKPLGRNFRLIGFRRLISGDVFILLLRILPRGSREYEHFLRDWANQTSTVLDRLQPYTDAEIDSMYDDLTRQSPARTIANPSPIESKWLYEVRIPSESADDLIVMETENWVQAMKESNNLPYLTSFHGILKGMIDDDIIAMTGPKQTIRIAWDSEHERGIMYICTKQPNTLLLLEAIKKGDNIENLRKKYMRDIETLSQNNSTVARKAKAIRSYLLLMILDQTAWIEIQRDDAANLALSPEETQLLQNIRNPHSEVGFPLFINGRAGSGKSTILQYLVADYVDFALRHDLHDGPLYMTCSEDLLERARHIVRKRLKADQNRLYENVLHSDDSISEALDRSFRVFHKFLYSLLPAEYQTKFTPKRYVDYKEFQLLWREQFRRHREGTRFSVHVSWHVIRSYIKGIRSHSDDDLAPEEFAALPRRRRSVSTSLYKDVYTHVWKKWYKSLCEREGYWDDQDIATTILELGIARSCNYAAVFCDEAQDFTSSELEIIYQLSLFSRRSLQPKELRNVPFVFAGDPLQTINPSGFRWSAVKASFHDRFMATLDVAHAQQSPEISLQEFQFNYRSNSGVVRFCNLIQLLRTSLAQDSDNAPQKPWWIGPQVSTVWFDADDNKTVEQLSRNPSFVKLVYCETEDETEYVQKDTVLRVALTAEDGIYRNVLGPTRAKGLEFSTVILYRFGQFAPEPLKKWIEGHIELPEDEDRLPLEHFLNQLYVAASRAKDQIIIVDSTDAVDSFWRFASERECWENLIEQTQDPQNWRDQTAGIIQGQDSVWSSESVNQEVQAEEYASRGALDRDSYLMRQAGLAYRGINMRGRATDCFAKACEFEGKYTEAGSLYEKIDHFDGAFRCYWKSQQWVRVTNLAAVEPRLHEKLECRASLCMLSSDPPERRFLDQLMSSADEVEGWKSRVSEDETWHFVLASVAGRLVHYIDSRSDFLWTRLFRVFDQIRASGIPISDSDLGYLAFASENFERAVELWEGRDESHSPHYDLAMAQIAAFPECLAHWSRAGSNKDIIRIWRRQRLDRAAIERLDRDVVLIVVDSAFAQQEFDLVRQLIDVQPEVDRSLLFLRHALESDSDGKLVRFAVESVTKSLVRESRWTEAVAVFRELRVPDLDAHDSDRLREKLSQEHIGSVILEVIVSELAVSDTCGGVQVVQDFLAETFVPRLDRSSQSARPRRSHRIAPDVVGAAIERAGRVVDALRYYERLDAQSTRRDVRRFALGRLVHNLEIHAGMVKDSGRAQSQARRAQLLRAELGIGDAKLPRFPSIGTRHDGRGAEAKDNHSMTSLENPSPMGDFHFMRSGSGDKLRIEHRRLFETVTIDANRCKLVSGDVDPVTINVQGEAISGWRIESWQSSVIRLTKGENVVLVQFECLGERREFTLRISH